MAVPSAATAYAAAHHGVVSSRVLVDSGLSAKQIRWLGTRGELVRLHRGVYAIGGTPATWHQRELAACLATDGVASHRAALRLWDTRGELGCGDEWPVEITVARGQCPRPENVIVHRSNALDSRTVSQRQGIPVTTPMRMLLDLGAVMETDEVARAVERCVASGLVPVAALRRELERTARRGRRGVAVLRSVLADWPVGDVRPDSVLEVTFARLCRDGGLPQPAVQYELVLDGQRRRVDFAYRDRRVAVEVDGFGTRTDRRVFQDERWRQNELVRAGWRVARFTWHDITQRPDYVVATIRSLLNASVPASVQP